MPLLVITIGVLFLLSNLGLLTRDLWTVFGRLWPVLIIALGVEFILGDRTLRDALAVIVSVLVVVGIGLTAAYLFGPSDWFYRGQEISETIGGAERAEIVLSGGVGSIEIDAAAPEGLLVGASLAVRLDERIEKAVWRTTRNQETMVRIELAAFGWLPEWRFRPGGDETITWQVHLTPLLPLDLMVRSSGGADFDLSQLDLMSVDLDLEAGGGRVSLPQGVYEAIIRADGDTVDIDLPIDSVFEFVLLSDSSDGGWHQISLPDRYTISDDGSTASAGDASSVDVSLVLELQGSDVRVRLLESNL